MIEKRPVKTVAIEIFHQLNKPIHYKVLTSMLLDQCNLTGKTPHESVRSLIGTDSRFKRVAEGVYALSEWEEYPEARFAKDIAYDILLGEEKPMHMDDLGKRILDERKFMGGPRGVVRNVVRSDKRFYFENDKQLVGLSEWKIISNKNYE